MFQKYGLKRNTLIYCYLFKMSRKSKYIRFKNHEIKIKSQFIIYVDFESILLPELTGRKIQLSLKRINIKTYCLQLWLQISICR